MGGKGQKRRKSTHASSSQSFDANMFRSQGCKDFYDTLPQNPSFVREKALRITEGDFPEILENIRMRRWERYVTYPQIASQALVSEFIANVNPQPEVDGTLTFPAYTSFVRGCVVPFDQISINELFGIPHVPVEECGYRARLSRRPKDYPEHAVEILRALCIPDVDWVRNGYGDPRKIKTKYLTPVARGWADFILHTISPCSNQSELHVPRATLATSIVLGDPINLGVILQDELLEFSRIKIEKKEWWRHASLIAHLCLNAGVRVRGEEKVIEPGKPITGSWIRSHCNLAQQPQIEPQEEPHQEQPEGHEPTFSMDDFSVGPSAEDFRNLQARVDTVVENQGQLMANQEDMRAELLVIKRNQERLIGENRFGMRALYRALAAQSGGQLDPQVDIYQPLRPPQAPQPPQPPQQ